MPQQIEIPGMGVVEFPDGMSDDQISAAIRQNMPQQQAQPQQPRGVMDRLLGMGGERYQTWPERAGRGILSSLGSAATLPGDVMSGKAQLPSHEGSVPGSVPYGDPASAGPRVADMAAIATSMVPKAAPSLARVTGKPPTVPELETAAEGGYTAARNLGVDIKASSVKNATDLLRGRLEQDGINAELAPKTFSILTKLQSSPEGAVATVQNLETVRRTLRNASRDFTNPTEQMAAGRAIEHFDDYLANLPQADLLAGDAARASKLLSTARGNYAAAKRSEQVTGEIERAELQAASANSGANVGNATRQRLRNLYTNPKKIAGYSGQERGQMERTIRGTAPGNLARLTGNLMGGGGGLGAVLTGGMGAYATAPYGGIGAVIPAIGYGLKHLGENTSVARQARILDEMVRSRSPLAQSSKISGPTSAQEARRAALIRALLSQQAQGAQ